MNKRDNLRYDVLIYGQAALLAAEHGLNIKSLRATLEALGVTDEGQLEEVRKAQTDKEYYASQDGRGLWYDEGVYEAVKNCLRPIYGF